MQYMRFFVIQSNAQSMTAAPNIHILATNKNIVRKQISDNQKMNGAKGKKRHAAPKKSKYEKNALKQKSVGHLPQKNTHWTSRLGYLFKVQFQTVSK